MTAANNITLGLLWDESFMWALVALDAFNMLGINTKILTSDDIRLGALDGCDLLFVPGGWASDKTVRLGDEGRDAVRGFVESGGGYVGFCGGAGLALDVRGGLGLVDVARVPTEHRVPSFSGRMRLRPADIAHPVWAGIRAPYEFNAWWPGQFEVKKGSGVEVVATYSGFGADFTLADLNASDVGTYDHGWREWEGRYGINLDPSRLLGEPAMLEARYGEGRVFLSYLHLETPGSRKGHAAIANLVRHVAGRNGPKVKKRNARPRTFGLSPDAATAADCMMKEMRAFMEFGERNFLWYWRNSWVLQWRRGVRGLEYSALYALVKRLRGLTAEAGVSSDADTSDRITALAVRLLGFLDDAKALLMKERFALMSGSMSTIRSDDEEVNRLREKLFSGKKRLGGEYKSILDELDGLILSMLRASGL